MNSHHCPSHSSGRSTPDLSFQTSSTTRDTVSLGTASDLYSNPPHSPLESDLPIDCPFYWTGCMEQCESSSAWRSHCLSHMEVIARPALIDCSFCLTFTTKPAIESSCLDQILDHILQNHRTTAQRKLVRQAPNSFRETFKQDQRFFEMHADRKHDYDMSGISDMVRGMGEVRETLHCSRPSVPAEEFSGLASLFNCQR